MKYCRTSAAAAATAGAAMDVPAGARGMCVLLGACRQLTGSVSTGSGRRMLFCDSHRWEGSRETRGQGARVTAASRSRNGVHVHGRSRCASRKAGVGRREGCGCAPDRTSVVHCSVVIMPSLPADSMLSPGATISCRGPEGVAKGSQMTSENIPGWWERCPVTARGCVDRDTRRLSRAR